MALVSRALIYLSITYLFVHAIAVRPLVFVLPPEGSFYTVPKMVNLGIWSGIVLLALLFTIRRVDPDGVLATVRRNRLLQLYVAALVLLLTAPFLATRTELPTALFGYAFRYDGPWVIVLSLLILGALARFGTLDRRFLFVGVGSFVAVTFVTAIFAILQTRGVDVWAALGVAGLGALPPRTTLGNPAFASLIPAMGAIVVAQVAAHERIRTRIPLFVSTLVVAAILAFAAGSASSRSAVIGYWVVLAIWTIVATLRSGSVRRALVPLLVTGILLGFQWLGGNANTYASTRFESLNDLVTGQGEDRSWADRIRFWRIAGRALQDQPLRPYGAGAFSYVMWERATPEEASTLYELFIPIEYIDRTQRQDNILYYVDDDGQQHARRVNSDKIHNYILDSWFAYGLFPTLALMAFLVALIVRMVQANTTITWAVLSAGVVYAFFSMAWFPAVATDPVVYALLGIGWGAAERTLRGIPDVPFTGGDEGDGAAGGAPSRGRQPRSRAEARRMQREASKRNRRGQGR